MKEKLKNQNGITLIALIITIIVLLILAMVSIKLIWDGGIIAHSKNAVEKYSEAQQNEIEQLNNIFGNNENQNNVPDELQKYVLGDELKGQPLEAILDMNTGIFTKQVNGKNVELLTLIPYTYTEGEDEEIDGVIYIIHDGKVYRIQCDLEGINANMRFDTKSINLVYEPKGREGKKVEYSIDGTEANKKEWTILYDNGENIEIISPEAMGSLTLGAGDLEAIGNNNFEKAVDSYNHAIERINVYTNSLVTNLNKLRVRSAGSNPNDPNSRNTQKYISVKLEELGKELKLSYGDEPGVNINGIAERSDNNYEQDYIRMFYHGIIRIGGDYWLASRQIGSVYDDEICLSISAYNNNSSDMGVNIVFTDMGIIKPSSKSMPVRPVVKVDASKVEIK